MGETRKFIDLFAERFWKKLEENRKYDWFKEFRRVEGEEPMYVYMKERTVLVIYGKRNGEAEYNIWIYAPNKGWYANVEVKYEEEEDMLHARYFVSIDDRELTWRWDIIVEAMKKIGGVVSSTISEIHEKAKRRIEEKQS